MILHLGPETPGWLRTLADAALVTHIGGATTALIAGPAALVFKKGSLPHRLAGNAFFAGMLGMSIVGALVAPLFPDRISSLMGFFAFYVTVTGWLAARRADGEVGRTETLLGVYALAVAGGGVALGRLGSGAPLDGEPSQIAYVAAALAALGAVCDFSVVWRGGLSGASRIARHIWRICLALFIAAGSFAGQPKAQPEFLRGSPWLFLPALVVLGVMLFWLIRVRLPQRRRRRQAAALAIQGA